MPKYAKPSEIERRKKRGLKKDTPIITGYQIFHNIRGHEGLKGKTPAEACGISILGIMWLTHTECKWKGVEH